MLNPGLKPNLSTKLFKYKKTILFLLLVLLWGEVRAQSGDFWQQKEYKKWDERDCRKILDNSPWSQIYTTSAVLIEDLSSRSVDRAREGNPKIEYHVQFRSALPVRQSMVRLSQIAQKYDSLSAEQKQAFDASAEQFLTKSFTDSVVVYVAFKSNVQNYERDLIAFWQRQVPDDVKSYIFLTGAKGEKVTPVKYTLTDGGRAFQLTFPRQVKGKPLAALDDDNMRLVFPQPRIGEIKAEQLVIEFKVKKMKIKDEVVY